MRLGFTLTEVLIASSLLTLGLGTAAFLMASAYGTYRAQYRTMEAQHLVHDRLEFIVASSYSQLAADLATARNPGDPPREALPAARDFVKDEAGGVKALVELVPPQEGEHAYKERRRDPAAGIFLQLSGKQRPPIELTLRLQHWDPTLDRPSETAAGLVRATCLVNMEGVHDEGVVYVAR
jgi:prepilin-type N-terminal cleavage/methylation domain-containing protein